MSQTITLTLTARDQTSGVFQKLNTDAKAAGTSLRNVGPQATAGLSQVGTAAAKAAAAVDKAAESAERTGRSYGQLGGAIKGLVGSSLVGFLSDSARAAAEADVSANRLQATIEATGRAYGDYAGQIEAASAAALQLGFDDEDALDALSTMTQATGDMGAALDDLSIAQDLARGKGIDLATASQIVGKVAAGNTGILARYGIVLEDGATAQEALAAIQQRYAGQAEAYGASTQGALDRARVAFANLQEEVGGAVGPFQEVIALLPGLSSGFAAVAGGVGALAGDGGIKGLASSLGPLAATGGPLALAALGIAGIGYAIWDTHKATEQMISDMAALATAAAGLQSISLAGQFTDLVPTLDAVAEKGVYVWGADAQKTISAYEQGLARLTQATSDNVNETFAALAAQQLMQAAWDAGDATIADRIALTTDLTTIMADSGPAHQQMIDRVVDLNNALSNGMPPEQYAAAVHDLATVEMPRANQELRLAADNAKALTDAQAGYNKGIATQWSIVNSQANATNAQIRANAQAGLEKGIATQFAAMNKQADDLTEAQAGAAAATEESRQKQEAAAQAARQLALAYDGQLIPALGGTQSGLRTVAGSFEAMVKPGEDVVGVLTRIGQHNPFTALVAGLDGAARGLDGVLGTFKAIDSLAARTGQTGGILKAVFGDGSVVADLAGRPALDAINALRRGILTVDQYGAAVAASSKILGQNRRIERDLASVRAQQVPTLERENAAYAQYIRQLERANPEEQRRALYLMDSANQAKVAGEYSLAYAASIGQLPKEVASSLILDTAQADPELKAVLLSYGLIEEGAKGQLRVVFPDGDKRTLGDVVSSVDHLNDTIVHFGISLTGDTTLAKDLVEAKDAAEELDGSKATVTVAYKVAGTAGSTVPSPGLGGTPSKAAIEDAAGGRATNAPLSANTGGSLTQQTVRDVAAATKAGQAFAALTFAATLSADPTPVFAAIGRATTALRGPAFVGGRYEATLAATDGTEAGVAAARRSLDDWARVAHSAGLEATNATGAGIAAADKALSGWAGGLPYAHRAALDTTELEKQIKEWDKKTVGTVYFKAAAVTADGTIDYFAGGGTVTPGRSVPRAANGRMVMVGEAGPELAILPYGTQVLPHGASKARVAAEERREAGGRPMVNYGTIHVHPPNADVAREVARQMGALSR